MLVKRGDSRSVASSRITGSGQADHTGIHVHSSEAASDHILQVVGNTYKEYLLDEVSAKDKDLQLLRIRLQIRYKKI